MGLNIKNAEVHKLAQELARLTGETQTSAIKHALEERLGRLKASKSRAAKILEIGRDCANRLRAKGVSNDHARMLYGPDGMPK